MRKYLLPENGNFYKANLHCHTSISDGCKTPEQVKEIYKSLGYSVVAYTDHDVLIPHNDLCDDEFVALNAFEVETNENKPLPFEHIKTCHICFIALEQDNIVQPLWHRTGYLFANAPQHRSEVTFDDSEPDYVRVYSGEKQSEMMKTGRDKGFFVTYNHPTWSIENYNDYINYEGMHAFEMFNGSCIACGFDDYNPRVYDDLLRAGKKIYCIGADDNHNGAELGSRYCDSGVAYTVIKAPELKYRTITKALEDGNFYASEGPEIYELWYEDGYVHIKCSGADSISCMYAIRKAGVVFSENDIPVYEATFDIPQNCGYFRITVTDKHGKHACTNAYFVEDLLK